MMMKVEVISRETIIPSSPIPHHLSNFQLSFLDQLSPPVYVPILLFYPFDDSNTNAEKSNLLKKSLSETLTHFYPLAGRVKDNRFVDCNDEGAHYIVIHVNGQLSDVLRQPNDDLLKQFLPFEAYGSWVGLGTEVILAIQVNFFDCGGMAMGVCISHKLADASSLANFVSSWSAIARGGSDFMEPRFEVASLFPWRDLSGFNPTIGITDEKILAKSFVFDASMIAALRKTPPNGAAIAGTYFRKCLSNRDCITGYGECERVLLCGEPGLKVSTQNLLRLMLGSFDPPLGKGVAEIEGFDLPWVLQAVANLWIRELISRLIYFHNIRNFPIVLLGLPWFLHAVANLWIKGLISHLINFHNIRNLQIVHLGKLSIRDVLWGYSFILGRLASSNPNPTCGSILLTRRSESRCNTVTSFFDGMFAGEIIIPSSVSATGMEKDEDQKAFYLSF
ncbi:hypothetical protein HHK36_029491 [Tetracentron sinense]|uniref:Uncharacterized protein n=1 Tax=Tetracentron sinense TaxID=13715 RepID=A0A834YBE4_TETSI|nr:hypothetical protein HHK36_029491 [Tetracentron sinense]